MAWTRHGECNRCGHCCEKISRDVLVRSEAQVERDRDFYAVRGFTPTTVDGQTRYVLWAWLDAPCPQLAKIKWYGGTDYRCRINDAKPQTCVDFPQSPQDIVGTPCSYWFDDGTVRIGGHGSPHPGSVDALLAAEEQH